MVRDQDDIVIEDDPDSTSQGEREKKLLERAREAEAKAKEYLDGWQKSQADFVNLRKRDEEEKKSFVKFATQGLVEELIPVLDSFNIAVSAGHNELLPIKNQLLKVLQSRGLEELDPVGEGFDPNFHESVALAKVSKLEEDGKVVDVLQKGYTLAGRVVRPAKVRVGEFEK